MAGQMQLHPRSGMTLLEVSMALVLLTIVVLKANDAIGMVTDVNGEETREIVLEDQARRVLRQVGYAVMGSDRETLMPSAAAPLSADAVNYRINLGVQGGEVVWGDTERIAMEQLRPQVYWSRNPETEAEQRVVWTSLVAPFLEGELPNGMDDNGNGLIDESGLCFDVVGDSVTIHLTLQRVGDDGQVTTKTVETTVTCRNLGDPE